MARVHLQAARSAGATVVGIASSSSGNAQLAAARLGIPVAFDSARELVASSKIDTVHVCTPNGTHETFAAAVLEAGKHVICEKPLAMSVDSARDLLNRASDAGTVAAVPFVYRFHPMVREARARVGCGKLGRLFVVHGGYLQDWLLSPDDDDWRVDAQTGGPSRAFADIGSHLCDLIEFVTDDRIARLNAVTRTVHPTRVRTGSVHTEDAAVLMFQTLSGAIGTMLVSQVSAGRKNRLSFEIAGENESLVFDQESPETLWVGRRDGFHVMPRDAALLDASAARYATIPAGHPQGYQDAFNAFVADAYRARHGPVPDGLPTFADGYRAVQLTDAVLRSDRKKQWVDTPVAPEQASQDALADTGSAKGENK
jgi:predicted dehydrogenase